MRRATERCLQLVAPPPPDAAPAPGPNLAEPCDVCKVLRGQHEVDGSDHRFSSAREHGEEFARACAMIARLALSLRDAVSVLEVLPLETMMRAHPNPFGMIGNANDLLKDLLPQPQPRKGGTR